MSEADHVWGETMKTNVAKKFFTAAADTCLSKSKHHGAMAKAHGVTMEEYEKDSPEHAFHKTAKALNEGQAEDWAGMAQTCAECAKDVGAEMMSHKAAGMGDDLDELEPSPISRVTPDVPHVRAVPRFGQRIPENVPVDPVFEKVFGAQGTDE
jgi:hypothetical protein